MYEIKAKLIANRINISRGGSRARRLPSIVLATGDVLRIAPGRSVRVTEQVYSDNKQLLEQFSDMIDVVDLREIKSTQPVSFEPVKEENNQEEQPMAVQVAEPDSLFNEETDEELDVDTPEKTSTKKSRSRSRKKKVDDA